MKSLKKEKRLTKKEQLQKRRYDFWRLMSHGATLADAVKMISEKYGVGKAVLYSDWAKREEWGVVEEPEKNRIVKDGLFSLQETRRYLWNLINASPEQLNEDGVLVDSRGVPMWPFELPDVKLRATTIAKIIETDFAVIRMTQSIGIVPQKGMTISMLSENSAEIEKNLDAYCGDDVELKRAVLVALDTMARGVSGEES